MFDFSGWSNLRLTDEPVKTDAQYKLVYDKEIHIYENTHAFPRAFLVGSVIDQADDDSVVTQMKQPGFDPGVSAVIKSSDALNLDDKEPIGRDAVKVDRYQDQRIELSVNAPKRSLLVLSDTYYPGWQAYIDGKKVNTYQTDLALRGIVVPEGSHKVVFQYQPRSFGVGLLVSLVSIFLASYGVWRSRRAYGSLNDDAKDSY